MGTQYDISDLVPEDTVFLDQLSRDLAKGLHALSPLLPAVTIYGSSRVGAGDAVYQQAESIARHLAERGFSIVTGGGPGVMEAANKGAKEAGGVSVGINIWLPNEQKTNTYATISLEVRHFFVRKLMLVKYASAVIFLPGGYGTLDELFETLTLIQTERLRPVPVILVGSWYWTRLVEWIRTQLLPEDFIRPSDATIFVVADQVSEVLEHVQKGHKVVGSGRW